jgi:hypothetical protein
VQNQGIDLGRITRTDIAIGAVDQKNFAHFNRSDDCPPGETVRIKKVRNRTPELVHCSLSVSQRRKPLGFRFVCPEASYLH